jgi:hypothetical protein
MMKSRRASDKLQMSTGIDGRDSNNRLSATSYQERATPTGAVSRILFWLCVLFIFYETAIPFRIDLTSSGLRNRWERSEWIPFLDNDGSLLSLADAVGNVLLFVPFGFFLHNWRLARRSLAPVKDVNMRASVLAALVYSGAIEILQLGLDRRTTSVNDLITNFTGAYIGVKLALVYPGAISAAWRESRRVFRNRPVFVAMPAIMLAQTLIALLPFDFTLQQENFQRQWLRWQYSWQALPGSWQFSSGWIELLRKFPHHEYLLVTLLATGGCGILLGASWVFCRRQYDSTSPRMVWGSALVVLGFYPALTIFQFIVQSVRPFVFFPITGICGVILGVLLMTVFLRLTSALSVGHEINLTMLSWFIVGLGTHPQAPLLRREGEFRGENRKFEFKSPSETPFSFKEKGAGG